MSTGNFNFKNRCIVISNDDYEVGNVPEYTQERTPYYDCGRDYFGKIIDDRYTKNLIGTELIITSGYWEHCCLDYYQDIEMIRDNLNDFNYWDEFETLKRFKMEFENYFNEPYIKPLRKAIKETTGEKDLNKRIESIFSWIEDIILEKEQVIANKMLDKIKKDYGYIEVKVTARFSSGETWYEDINKKKV